MNLYRVPLRLPPEWKGRIKTIADREHRSVHAQIVTWIERGLALDAAPASGTPTGPDQPERQHP